MAEFTKEQRDILIKTAEYMVKRENTSEYSDNIRKVAEIALAALTAPQLPQPAVMDENGLLPCPFCGGKPEEDAGGCSEYDGHEHQDYSINCKSCGAEVYCAVGSFEKADVPCSCHHNTRAVCVGKWNSRAAMLQAGNSPVTTDGWVMVPKEMTDAIGEAIAMHANCCGGIALDIYDAMLAAAPQQQ